MRLTVRGIGLLAAGAVLAIVAASVDALSLARMSVLLLALVAMAVIAVLLSRRRTSRMRLQRRVDPVRPVVGEPATVHLRVASGGLGPWSRLRERAPSDLKRSPVQAGGGDREAWHYRIRPGRRGFHRLGPATVLHTDPLGLVRWPVQADTSTSLLVWPRSAVLAESLPLQELGGSQASTVGLPERSVEDLTVREYVPGDDIGRVHWRSSARRGELMVRSDEPSRPPAIDMVLDIGHGPGAEWAVSAFASLALALIADGVPVRLQVCRRPALEADPVVTPVTCSHPEDALDTIAPALVTPKELRRDQAAELRRVGPSVVTVLHQPHALLLETLSRLAENRRAYGLVVLDSRSQVPPLARMTRHGWSVHTARARTDSSGIARSWEALLEGVKVR